MDAARVPVVPVPATVVVRLKLTDMLLLMHVMAVALNPGQASSVGVAVRLDVPAEACHADTWLPLTLNR